ncbi:hypothetical protein GCM10009801_23220 [Streptomyces albiaxialis]|uniref:Secreted protein n=1 Tax=Streptomyces albiaxialis TaxID=329523 RepID=A0ABN2VT47_9ACTN
MPFSVEVPVSLPTARACGAAMAETPTRETATVAVDRTFFIMCCVLLEECAEVRDAGFNCVPREGFFSFT